MKQIQKMCALFLTAVVIFCSGFMAAPQLAAAQSDPVSVTQCASKTKTVRKKTKATKKGVKKWQKKYQKSF